MDAQPLTIARSEHAGSRWELAGRVPCAPLRRYVRALHGFDERAPGPRSRREFPEPWVVLIFELGAPLRVTMGGDARNGARYAGGFAAGLGDTWATTEHAGSLRGIQVDLTPTGARRLFGIPLSEIAGRIVALRDLLPDRTFFEALEEAPGWAAQMDLVEALLLRRMPAARVDTARVDFALSRIESAGGALDVGSLAVELGHSRKHLISLFRDQVGIPPKLLAQLVRFERAMRRARDGRPIRWADLALAHGYCDQAHLAREVKRFTGLTPSGAHASLSALVPLQVNSVQDDPGE